MTDEQTPPDWVLLEAAKRSKLSNDTPRQRAILFDTNPSFRALCDLIEQHEAFRQKVSDVVEFWVNPKHPSNKELVKFIIPKPKPDPLVEAMADCGVDRFESWADKLRAALDARGFEIREKNDD